MGNPEGSGSSVPRRDQDHRHFSSVPPKARENSCDSLHRGQLTSPLDEEFLKNEGKGDPKFNRKAGTNRTVFRKRGVDSPLTLCKDAQHHSYEERGPLSRRDHFCLVCPSTSSDGVWGGEGRAAQLFWDMAGGQPAQACSLRWLFLRAGNLK